MKVGLPVRFDWRAKLATALETLAAPPADARLVRPAPRGKVVARIVLPLELCPTTNRTRHTHPGEHVSTKKRLLALMQVQTRTIRRREPLPGRPQVVCVRFSSVEPDAYSDWAKMAVDALCVPAGRRKKGLGFLRDDRPADTEVIQRWEPAKAKDGFVFIEVRTG